MLGGRSLVSRLTGDQTNLNVCRGVERTKHYRNSTQVIKKTRRFLVDMIKMEREEKETGEGARRGLFTGHNKLS